MFDAGALPGWAQGILAVIITVGLIYGISLIFQHVRGKPHE